MMYFKSRKAMRDFANKSGKKSIDLAKGESAVEAGKRWAVKILGS